MRRDVRERQVRSSHQNDLGRVAVLALAQVGRVLDGLSEHLRGRGMPIDQAYVPVELIFPVQLQILADQNANADARHVELVEEGVDLTLVGKLAFFVFGQHLLP